MSDPSAVAREISSEFENRIACLFNPQPDMSGRQINRLHGERRRQVEDIVRDMAEALDRRFAEGIEEAARIAEEQRCQEYFGAPLAEAYQDGYRTARETIVEAVRDLLSTPAPSP